MATQSQRSHIEGYPTSASRGTPITGFTPERAVARSQHATDTALVVLYRALITSLWLPPSVLIRQSIATGHRES